jgi:hypothetical protein
MSKSPSILGVAALGGLLFSLAAPALAQPASTPPDKMAVPNSSTQVKCNPNGTGTVTNTTNAETSTTNNVPGTPVTSNNPAGSGTTTTQTPTLAKPTSATVQCAKTEQPMTQRQNAAPAMPQNSSPAMNALTNNPNGSDWLAKFNRPTVAATHKTKHHVKRASGGGGH